MMVRIVLEPTYNFKVRGEKIIAYRRAPYTNNRDKMVSSYSLLMLAVVLLSQLFLAL